ncbi:MAG TPA: hypothetical protein VFI23_13700 [Rhizomicrobium sp.]|nr:hypothetical protein [Rhizomicrobium sp.]
MPSSRSHPERPGLRTLGAGQGLVRKRDRVLAGVLAVCAHLLVIAALFWPRAGSPPAPLAPEAPSIQVSLLPKPPGPPDAAQAHQEAAQPMPPPPKPRPDGEEKPVPDNSDLLNESQLAGAASTGEGTGSGGGGGCDMARAVQQALRRDPLVRAAVEDANRLGKAVMLWNGDWVRTGVQEGKGLSAVREAIVWEVAFTPAACRNQPMHGMVVLSLADGNTRFAIGAGEWRWSDLLGMRPSNP